MNNLYGAAIALMVAGLSIGVALLWLRRLSRLHRQRMDQLLALREALHEDPLGTLLRHQNTLARLGLRSIDWQGSWYGSPVDARPQPFAHRMRQKKVLVRQVGHPHHQVAPCGL